MCMPTNFGSRKKHYSSFKREKKKKSKKEDFFCNSEEFLNEKNSNENFSIKS